MESNSILQRLVELKEYFRHNKGMSTKAFETRAGLANGYFRTRTNGGGEANKSVSMQTLEKVRDAFPEVNMDWLQTGMGEMFLPKTVNSPLLGRPYYDVDFLGGFDIMSNDQTRTPSSYISMEPFNKEDYVWCNITGDSMSPLIKSGSKICMKTIGNVEDILYGEVYALVTSGGLRTVKWVTRAEDESKLRLVPENKDAKYGDLPETYPLRS